MAIGSSALDAASPLKGERAVMDTTWKWFVGGVVLAALSLVPALPGEAQDVPDTIQIESLSHLYGGVHFDHAMHIDIAGGCAVCHHRGPGALAENEKCDRVIPMPSRSRSRPARLVIQRIPSRPRPCGSETARAVATTGTSLD